jgi:hypothetical protein
MKNVSNVRPDPQAPFSLDLNLSPISSCARPLFIIFEAIDNCGPGANS